MISLSRNRSFLANTVQGENFSITLHKIKQIKHLQNSNIYNLQNIIEMLGPQNDIIVTTRRYFFQLLYKKGVQVSR